MTPDTKQPERAVRGLTYDQLLILLTAVALFITGIVMLWGTFIHFGNSMEDPGWATGEQFHQFTTVMNSAAVPAVSVVILALGLCIPRRFLEDRILLVVSGIFLSTGLLVSAFFGSRTGFSMYMAAAIFLQLVVLLMFFLRSERLRFLKKKRIVQFGSLMGHLGIIIFVFDLVAIKDASVHLSIFWVSCSMIIAGFFLMFYPDAMKRR